jgi:hypothetical protein
MIDTLRDTYVHDFADFDSHLLPDVDTLCRAIKCPDEFSTDGCNLEVPNSIRVIQTDCRVLLHEASVLSIGTAAESKESRDACAAEDSPAARGGVIRSKNNWKNVLSILVKHRSAYFHSFLPRIALHKLKPSPGHLGAAPHDAADLSAEDTQLVILLVDISGFTALCDRFQALGQQGIDPLTASINQVFGLILTHLHAWGGDVVKFDGDALVVAWEPTSPNSLAETAAIAVACALALEAAHGRFDVAVPGAARLPVAGQLGRLASASPLLCRQPSWCDRGGVQDLEVLRALRAAPALACLSESDAALLAERCRLAAYAEGAALFQQGAPGDGELYVVHSGEVRVHRAAPRAASPSPEGSPPPRGAERFTAVEGDVLGVVPALNGAAHLETAVATRPCTAVVVPAAALRAALAAAPQLADALRAARGGGGGGEDGRPAAAAGTGTVTLRLHQAVAAGAACVAHIGGERMPPRPRDLGPRRELVVVGEAVRHAGEALGEAAVGEVVVAGGTWALVAGQYEGESTPGGNRRVTGERGGEDVDEARGEVVGVWRGRAVARQAMEERVRAPPRALVPYCHEGAREMLDSAHMADELRQLTVCVYARVRAFVRACVCVCMCVCESVCEGV